MKRFPFHSLLLLIALTVPGQAKADDSGAEILERVVNGKVYVFARLNRISDLTVNISVDMKNMNANRKTPFHEEISGVGDHTLVVLSAKKKNQPWSYYWHFDWKYGHALHKKPQPYLYQLPYRGSKRYVTQGPYGSFSHGPGSQDEDAYDFKMPIGTPICAARPGIVAAYRSDCSKGGMTSQNLKDYNYVVIRHDDGTYAEYAHCKKDGVLVKLGQKVRAGQMIALSGNTGHTSSPHLHFVAFYTVSGTKRITIPIQFRSPAGKPYVPTEGHWY